MKIVKLISYLKIVVTSQIGCIITAVTSLYRDIVCHGAPILGAHFWVIPWAHSKVSTALHIYMCLRHSGLGYFR